MQGVNVSRKNDKTFRKMFELGLDMINLLSSDGKITYASPATIDVLGYSSDEILGMGMFDLVHSDEIPKAQQIFHDVMTHPGEKYRFEMRLKHKNKQWQWMEIFVTNLLDDPDVKAIVTQGRDITARIQAQQALQQSEELLLATQERAHVGGWEYYPATNTGIWSPQMYELLRVDPKDGMVEMSEFYRVIHPDDLEMVQQKQQHVLETGEKITIEYRTHPERGSVRIIRATTEIVREPSDEGAWHLAGTVQDVTPQRDAERILHNYTTELEKRVRQRTDELQRTVNVMAGREFRIAELKQSIRQLRAQLAQAGLTPVADDPLLDEP